MKKSEIDFIRKNDRKKDAAHCSDTRLSLPATAVCIFWKAYKTRNAQVCKMFKKQRPFIKCIGLVALSTGSYKLCDQFVEERWKFYRCQQANVAGIEKSLDPKYKRVKRKKNPVFGAETIKGSAKAKKKESKSN